MKKYLLITVAVFSLVFQSHHPGPYPAASNKLYSESVLKKDLEEIRNVLLTNHPAPYQFSSREAFEKSYNELLKKINHPMNLGEYFIIAATLVESIHCGHTWISLPDDFWNNEGAIFFPLGLIFSGDKAFVAPPGKANTVPPGSEIISINKTPVSDIIESTKRLVNSDARSSTGKLANFGHSFPDLFAIQYGKSDSYEVNFIPPGGTEAQKQMVKPVVRESAWENTIGTLSGSFTGGNELHLEIFKVGNLAVMSIPTFGYYDSRQKFYAYIDSAFEQIHNAGIKNLILDLRNNNGGDPFCAGYLMTYLEKQPAPYFVHPYEEYESLAQPLPVSVKNAFADNLYVLINGGCFSTTGHLCALLKYSRRAVFVGEETGGTYECNDNHLNVQTSATHLNLNVARVTYTTAVKGLSRETGIVPEYPVEPTIDDVLARRDAVKQFAIRLASSDQIRIMR